MRLVYSFIMIYVALTLSACATTRQQPVDKPLLSTASTSFKDKTHKDPIEIAVYVEGKPLHPYKVIGTETISKYNTVGVKRQEAVIRDAMRNLAASMGGDAVINIMNEDKTITATVIVYDKTTYSLS